MDDPFEFRVVPSVHELERPIQLRAGDVEIGDWRRPWNAKPESGVLAAGAPKSYYWATDPGGLDQVGCVYTA